MTLKEISPEHPGCLCPLCDNAVEEWEPWTTTPARGFRFIVHQQCIDAEQDDESNSE